MRLLKYVRVTVLVSALVLGATAIQAQETNQLEQLQKQLQQTQESFEKQQREMRENFEKMIREQQAQIEALKKQVAAMPSNPLPAAPAEATTPEKLKELSDKVDAVVEAQTKVRPNEFNPSIGLVGEAVFSYRSKGSDLIGTERPGGFDVFARSIELNIAASVDPFAKGYVVANASADAATGEATFGIEEAALQTTSLPGNVELKMGRFFGEFGRLGYIHDHELPFVNRPLALDNYIGGESQTDGLQVNWLPPISHYVSLTAGIGDHFGGDSPHNNVGAYRSFNEFNFWGRLSTYFDLSPNWQLEGGISGLWNPNTEARGDSITQIEKERRLAGLDVKLSYVPLQNNQFRSFTWGTEVLYSDNRFLFDPDGTPATGDEFKSSVGSVGLYSYATYKWSRQWSGGFLFDWVQDAQDHHVETFAYSPYVTWALSHWNQLRLQYTHTQPNALTGLKPDDAIYLQWAWIIGSHSHGWQQR
jgi:uncharacterized membrane-anchored protein YhcB (DUF1043 family)